MTRVRNSNVSIAKTLKVRIAKSFSADFLSDNHHSDRLEFYLFYKIVGKPDKVLEVLNLLIHYSKIFCFCSDVPIENQKL